MRKYLQLLDMINIIINWLLMMIYIGDISGGTCSPNKYTIYQHYCDPNNIDVSSGYGF